MDCPNCVTPWKCNGPHIFTITDNIRKCDYGYFILHENSSEWIFSPIEQDFDVYALMLVSDTLRNLNEKQNDR
jgi:hypothetical protein